MTWIGLYTGGRVDYVDPRPEQFTIEDIARGLARINRFAGQTHEPYSVAQHSVIVSRLAPPELALCGLLHDASEAVTGDCPRPLKLLLPGFREVEERLMSVIAERFGIPWPMPPEIKEIDRRLLATEKLLLQPAGPKWESLREVRPYPRFTIWYQNWHRAETEFLQRYEDLTNPLLSAWSTANDEDCQPDSEEARCRPN